jgi:HD-GYP domain-containing protein (c-di-GMP phosphodiesterase class II)
LSALLPQLQATFAATVQRAQVLLPQLERVQCFALPAGWGDAPLLLHDSAAADGTAPGLQPLFDPRADGDGVHAEQVPGGVIAFQAREGAGFDAGERQTLALVAQAMACGLHLREAESPLNPLRLAAEVAHASAFLRDGETGNHLERVNRITRLIATAVAPHYGLSDTFVEQVSTFARLHDIGKIGIPDAILLKPGRLDAEEMAVMRTHVRKGLEILDRVLAAQGVADQEATRVMTNLVATHHERLDGSGYPAGLRGEEIPVEGRIVAVADVFDALTHTRPYRQSLSVGEGLAIVRQQADAGQLDPVCVAALEAQRPALEQIVAEFRDLP